MNPDRKIALANMATEEFWVRIQRARCRAGQTHYRRLMEPDSGRITLDLGQCAHFKDDAAKGESA